MMARIPSGVKVEKVCSRDVSRPVLAAPAIVEWEGGRALAATDSYKLVVVPLADADGLEVGPLSLELVRAAVKDAHAEITSTGAGGVTTLEAVGDTSTRANVDGQFPDVGRLFPDAVTSWEVGLNARYLFELAQSMGSDVVAVSFVPASASEPAGAPNVLRPMFVRPSGHTSGRSASPVPGARGLLMPIRVAPAS